MAEPKHSNTHHPIRVTLTVRAGIIRDGTPGISLSIGEKLLGEWTDSRAKTLSLKDDLKIAIRGEGDNHLYLFGVPGREISGEQLSDVEVRVTFEMD